MKPSDNETRTWHEHDDGTWAWGVVCDKCTAPRVYGTGPMFNIKRLKADNAGHYTQHGLAREVEDAARKDGRDITRAK